jgi:zinc transport system ATP-binding protein
METILTVKNLNVNLSGHKILDDISFEVNRDETVAIIGPNGAGKTVLFRALLGFIPYEGEVNWTKDLKIGYVPQKLFVENDFPLTVNEFFQLKEKSSKEIENAITEVGLEGYFNNQKKHILNQKLGVLSGGEFQKVLITRALLGHPQVLLFDEPTSGVDISSEETIYSLLRRLQEKEDLTILLISHELQVVYKYASNVICLNKERVCFGPPREVLDKESLEKTFGSDVGVYQHHDHHSHQI